MTWATGCILLCLALIAIWAGAELVSALQPKWMRRLDDIERGRIAQQAEYIARGAFYSSER